MVEIEMSQPAILLFLFIKNFKNGETTMTKRQYYLLNSRLKQLFGRKVVIIYEFDDELKVFNYGLYNSNLSLRETINKNNAVKHILSGFGYGDYAVYTNTLVGSINLYDYIKTHYPDFSVYKSRSTRSLYITSKIRGLQIRVSDHDTDNDILIEKNEDIKKFIKITYNRLYDFTYISTRLIYIIDKTINEHLTAELNSELLEHFSKKK